VFGNVTGCRVAKVPAATADNKPVSDPQTQAPLRRKLGKGWIALAYAAVLALPAWRFLLPFTCGEKLTLATGVLFFISPVRVLGGWFLSIARPPRTVGYWAVPIAVGIPFWYHAALRTGCSSA
jgi:hypothetical protein